MVQPTRLVRVDGPPEDINISVGSSAPGAQSPLESSEVDLSERQVKSNGQGNLSDDSILRRSTRQTHRPEK